MMPLFMELPGFVIATFATALLAAAATPLFARLAARTGLVVRPRVDRWHRAPTPLLGGAAIALAALVILAVATPAKGVPLVVLGASGLAFGLGLLDDFRHLAPTSKLVGQVLVASVLALGGVRVEIIEIAPVAFVLTVFWVVGMMNALNLLDNMDGLAAGVTAIAALVLGITALPENPLAAVVAAATAGAALGFLVHNFSPARVFMGDAGSHLLGFLLATVALLHTASGAANLGLAVLGPLVVLALPIFDTALVAASRGLAGLPISQGGRDHASHRLAALGLSDRGAVLVLYAVAATLAVVGVLLDAVSTLVAPLIALAAVMLALFGIFLGEVDVYGHGRREEASGGDRPIMRALSRYGRFGAEVGLDVVLLTTAYYLAYTIRYEGVAQSAWLRLFVESVPIVIPIQLAVLVVLGIYRTLWRYIGVADTVAIVRAVTLGTGAAALAIVIAFRFQDYSRAVFLLDWLLATAFIIGARSFLLWLQHWFAVRPRADGRRVLIVGANESGALALRLLTRAADASFRVVGFLDDDPGKRYRRVGGVPIVGTLEDLERSVARLQVDVVALAEGDEGVRELVRTTCRELGIECRDFLVPV